MADLFGTYDKRIKLTISNTNVDSDLSDFPVTIFFTSTQAEEIFTEFDADSDYMKCAFTSSDGTTQLYAEKELFDDSEQKAIYHVKVTSVSSSAGTDIYYYYDNSASDNTTYIGAINTTAGGHVWDSNFKAVYHMIDATTSTILDSTSNNNDGTKKAANEPIETTGEVGQAQDFDGSDDKIDCGNNASLEFSTNDFGVGLLFKTTDTTDTPANLIGKMTTDTTATGWRVHKGDSASNNICFDTWEGSANSCISAASTGYLDGEFHYLYISRTGTTLKIYLDGVEKTSTALTLRDVTNSNPLWIGKDNWENSNPFDGDIDEIRISVRSAAWIKATYNSLWDSLLTYSSEETKPSADNAVMFGINF